LAIAAVGFSATIIAGLIVYGTTVLSWDVSNAQELDKYTSVMAWAFVIATFTFGTALVCLAVFAAFAVT